MKHFIYTLLLLSVAPIAAAQDYEISGTQGETITLNISGFADERSTFAFAQTTGGSYTSDGFNQSTGQISFKFEKAEEYSSKLGCDTLFNWIHPNNDKIIAFLKSKGYSVLNMIELRKPFKGETPHKKIMIDNKECDY